jgi:hypothetical protein
MQRELRAVDVTLPVMTATTMAQDLENAQAAPRMVATFLGALGGIGLVLASIGLYAVVAFSVARRSREIGIRMALGARSQQVVWSIARGVARLIGVGTSVIAVVGVAAAFVPGPSRAHGPARGAAPRVTLSLERPRCTSPRPPVGVSSGGARNVGGGAKVQEKGGGAGAQRSIRLLAAAEARRRHLNDVADASQR